MTSDLIFQDVQLPDGRTATLRCSDGLIASVEAGPAATVRQGNAWVALPRLIDAHVHLDKTLLGPRWYPHRESSVLADRIAFELDLLESDAVEPVAVRASRLIETALANGVTQLQSHVDVSARLGTSRFDGVLAARDAYAGRCDVVLVAFPQEGIVASPGTAAMLESAIKDGCDAVGGLDPAEFDGDRDAHLDVVFGIAERHGCRVDIHLHEAGQTGIDTLRAIAERCRVLSLGGRVCVSHGYSLAQVPVAMAASVAEELADAGVGVVTSAPGEGLMPPLRLLREHGVVVAVASDNIRDSWWPYGKADPLERASTAGYISGFHTDDGLLETLEMVTAAPARLLGLPPVTFSPGDPADFTLVSASSAQEAIVAQPVERVVVKAGRIVAGSPYHIGIEP